MIFWVQIAKKYLNSGKRCRYIRFFPYLQVAMTSIRRYNVILRNHYNFIVTLLLAALYIKGEKKIVNYKRKLHKLARTYTDYCDHSGSNEAKQEDMMDEIIAHEQGLFIMR